ncbi:MAG: hybrid sensor histidine kinase/response regulator [Verrucomicrobiota bacterium]
MHDYKRYCILYVDDEEMSLKYFQKSFGNDFRILTASSAAEGMRLIQERGEEIGVLLTDQRMPGEKGLQLIERARQIRPRMVRMMITAYADFGVTVDAVNQGNIFRYISKPIQIEDMRNTLKRALEYFLLQRERDELLLEKLSVVQNMIVTDRIISLGVLAAGLSQHLRNPLDAVSTFLHQTPAKLRYEELDMNRLRDPSFWRDFHAQVLKHAHHVSELVSHLDGIATAGASETAADPEPIIQSVLAKFQSRLTERRITVQTDIAAGLPALHVEPSKFARIFELLLEDELVNLPEGSTIRFQAAPLNVAGSPVRIQFTLSDDGPGMPPDSLRSVFDPFASRDAAGQQFGLNLLGVFFLTHHYGGSVKATDNQGKGVTYILEIPVTSAPAASASASSEEFITKVLVNDALWEKLLAGA